VPILFNDMNNELSESRVEYSLVNDMTILAITTLFNDMNKTLDHFVDWTQFINDMTTSLKCACECETVLWVIRLHDYCPPEDIERVLSKYSAIEITGLSNGFHDRDVDCPILFTIFHDRNKVLRLLSTIETCKMFNQTILNRIVYCMT